MRRWEISYSSPVIVNSEIDHKLDAVHVFFSVGVGEIDHGRPEIELEGKRPGEEVFPAEEQFGGKAGSFGRFSFKSYDVSFQSAKKSGRKVSAEIKIVPQSGY